MTLSGQFECECTVVTTFDFTDPAIGNTVFQPVCCQGCDAVWEVRFRKTISGKVLFTYRLDKPSLKLGEFLKKKKLDALVNKPQKKAPMFYVPGNKNGTGP